MKNNLTIEKFTLLENYKIKLWFSDSTFGIVNLESECWGEVFEPLKEISFFRQVKLNSDTNTLTWPNGADFAPEYLKQLSEVVTV